tara:strand:- start:526 stop:765 length:240 start_codon:yes stop_codon:yes gene_type:complete
MCFSKTANRKNVRDLVDHNRPEPEHMHHARERRAAIALHVAVQRKNRLHARVLAGQLAVPVPVLERNGRTFAKVLLPVH